MLAMMLEAKKPLIAFDIFMSDAMHSGEKVSSDKHACVETEESEWNLEQSADYLSVKLRWGIASTTAGSITFHQDSDGLASFIEPVHGTILCIFMRPADGHIANHSEFGMIEHYTSFNAMHVGDSELDGR